LVGGEHAGAGLFPGSAEPTGGCVRKFVYAVAALLAALAPLAAIGPASAAVRHPAAAQVPCQGNPEVLVNNGNPSLIGYWNVPSSGSNTGVVLDSYSHMTEFCMLQEGTSDGQGWAAFRQYGTSNCATWSSSSNQVNMQACDPSDRPAQNWTFTGVLPYEGLANSYTEELYGDFVDSLDGLGGDTPVFMSPANLYISGQDWY
jgi:hypothetical protein